MLEGYIGDRNTSKITLCCDFRKIVGVGVGIHGMVFVYLPKEISMRFRFRINIPFRTILIHLLWWTFVGIVLWVIFSKQVYTPYKVKANYLVIDKDTIITKGKTIQIN